MSVRTLSLKLATSERFSPYNIYPMRTIEIKYAILYSLSRHLMNTIYSTITSVVTFYSPHIPKLSARALNINRDRGTSPDLSWVAALSIIQLGLGYPNPIMAVVVYGGLVCT